ncbi:hypothetical protein DXT99_04975 [Pontibacter diazotrophicus]|uniref:Uncharacterized protein n=1 Tax=Pontibacter diazotrophicus TaxID=1400979 RepID=A0A3D8LGN7_9BACT|nr:hypothetical protein [Pontibacter diazotrophicus]RDV16548.1 hypothetical protein DXT99_04975 [Pontibacter diazotrophicus]
MFKVIRVDSTSYETLAGPYNFSKNKEPFYLITEDSVYILIAKSIKMKIAPGTSFSHSKREKNPFSSIVGS